MRKSFMLATLFVFEPGLGLTLADASPCAEEIDGIERIVQRSNVSPVAQQTIDAQLHHQPTPLLVAHAAEIARAEISELLARARKVDAENDAVECMHVVSRLTILLRLSAPPTDAQLQDK